MKPHNRANRKELGTQLVEFAIVMPMIVLLFFVVTEGAALVRTHQLLNNAAREGSRLCAAGGSDKVCINTDSTAAPTNSIVMQVRQYIATADPKLNSGNVKVEIQSPVSVTYTSTTGTTLSMNTNIVRVSYPYTLRYLPVFSAGLISPTFTLRAKAQFRNLYY